MSFRAIMGKELADLVREKRFGGWALTFLAFWTLFLVMFLAFENYNRDYPTSLVTLTEPAFFFLAIALVVLALFALTDGITKERESGMLPLVGARPIVRWHLPLAKLLAGLVIYALAFVVTLLPISVLAYSMGTPFFALVLDLFLGPLLALYVFLLGSGLLLGVVSSSSKVAIGIGAGLYLPMFLLLSEGPMTLLYRAYPSLLKVAAYTPFEAGYQASQVIARGGEMPWAELSFVIFLGAGLAALGFWLFQRQEVAA